MNPDPPPPGGGPTRLLHRAARVPPPRLPSGQIIVAAPPVPPHSSAAAASLTLLLPLLSTVAMAGYMISFGRPWLVVAGIAFVVLSVVATVAMRYQMSSGARRQRVRIAQRYRRHLAEVRREARAVAATQRVAATATHPSPQRLLGIVLSRRRVWERRPTDPDFLQVRVGLGRAPLCTPVALAGRGDPMVEAEPELAAAAAAAVAATGTVGRQPAVVDVGRAGVVSVVAAPEVARGVGRAVVLQVAVLQAPEDVAVAICAPGAADAWSWATWLPHVRLGGPAGPDGAPPETAPAPQDVPPGPVAVAADLAALTDLLEPWLARARAMVEARPIGGRAPTDPGRRLVLLIDGYDPGADWVREPVLAELLARAGPQSGVCVVCLVGATARQPPRAEVRVVVDDQGRIDLTGTGPLLAVAAGISDAPGPTLAECVARALAPLRLRPSAARRLVETISVPQLLGLSASELAGTGRWLPAGSPELLRVPIGLDLEGVPVVLDLKEAAQDGIGPHGLVVGATGSGKSEMLRTLVLGLATTHSPDLLNFVLVDFKGGATFANLVDLPHVAGLITNLADDMALVDRVRLALQGEQQRRQRLLRDAGNVDSVREYQLRQAAGDTGVAGQALPPLPYLLVIVDEFGELLAGRPDFIDLFVQIGRVGRSLGIHLLLASQRLDEGRLRGLESHLSYRIGLRTFSAAESRAVLGTPDAYLLPSLPGSAYLKVDETTYLRFRVSHVSGPAWPETAAESAPLGVLAFGPRTVVEFETPEPAPAPPSVTGPSTMDIVVAGLAATGTAAHQVWLPPLPTAVALGAILGPAVAGAERGVQAAAWPWPGTLRVPIGVQDRPLQQQQNALVLDFAVAGNLAAVGAPQTGKSTLLRTLMLATMLTHTPDEAQFACVDFGGGGLRAAAAAPHVAGVAGRREPELVRRVLLDTRRLVDERERLFAELRIDSPAQWRQRRAAGDLPPGTRAADVFLVLDNWPAVRSEVDLADEVVIDIAARGLGVAVHVVLTANRWLDVRANLRDSITTRLELRLNDPSESEVGRIAARGLVDAGPGRGISAPGVLFQAVLPRVDGNDTVDGLTEAQEDALGKLAAGWMGPPAPEIRTLPRRIGRSALWADPAAPLVAIGIDEVGLAPVGLDLEAEDQHLVVFGDSGAGKTQFLRTYLAALTRRSSSDHVRFLLLDYRRGLLGAVADDYVAAHAADATAAREYVAQLDAVLANRMPPPGHDPSSAGNHHWEGPEIYLVVDDYDAVGGASSPLLPLLDRLVQARDLGFHVVLARRVAGSARALMSDQFLTRIRDLQPAGLIMSGDPREGILLGDHRAGAAPPGRGQLIRRGHPATVVQTALDDGGDSGADGSGDGDRR